MPTLNHPTAEEIGWLRDRLDRESRRFGVRVEIGGGAGAGAGDDRAGGRRFLHATWRREA